jgi:cell division septum initiation protein DivIVA
VDVHDRLNQLTAMVRGAKAMPMSASCLVNRAEMLEQLQRLREELPANLDHADALLSEREAVLAAAREEAGRILEGARGERAQLIQQSDVLVSARARAAAMTTQARGESARLLGDADDYVDRKLSEFEVFLGQVGSQVNNGRLRLTVRREADLARFQEEEPDAVPGENYGLRDPSAESGRPDVNDGSGLPDAKTGSGPLDAPAESVDPGDPEAADHPGPARAEVPV